tara:strand:- start:380 stop:1708 length:1329 start_codon:yes stop_codon:yes gene_type:complete
MADEACAYLDGDGDRGTPPALLKPFPKDGKRGMEWGPRDEVYNPKTNLNIDINVTSICNLACTYCSEGESCGLSSEFLKQTDLSPKELVDNILKVKFSKYKSVSLYFWGGEPFQNFPFCKQVIEELAYIPQVNFMFYTNGTYLKKLLPKLIELDTLCGVRSDGFGRRLHFQVSFDGEPINTLERRSKKGQSKELSELVYSSYLLVKEAGLSTSLKGTLSMRNFKHVFETWKWHMDHNEYWGPTPDSHSTSPDRTEGDEETQRGTTKFEEYLKDLRLNVLKIAKYCVDHDIEPAGAFKWFKRERMNCSSGINYLSIDLDGKMYPCHGCMYRKRDEHYQGNMLEEDIQQIIDRSTEKYQSYLNDFKVDKTLNCSSCTVGYCLKCPAGTYDSESEFTDYGKKWQDHSATAMCKVWKTIDPIAKALSVHKFQNKGKGYKYPAPRAA